MDRREFLSRSGQAGLGLALTAAEARADAATAMRAEGSPTPDWFASSLFNLLVDYYTEVPFRPYGSGATAENVRRVLRELRPGYIIIYAKGHSGRTTFESSLGTAHEMLGRDMPATFRELTRETGTRLFLYYSGLLDGIAGTRHPEWGQQASGDHPPQYFAEFGDLFTAYAMCPQSGYFDEWVSVHLEELLTRYEPDGIWVDGDWAGPCQCPRCQGKDWFALLEAWHVRWRERIDSLRPGCFFSAGNVSPRRASRRLFDWISGDWFSPNNHRLHQSIMMRRYTVTDRPYDAFTCDTVFVHSRPQIRSRSKPLCRMLQEGAGVLANGGQWGYWTYPMPDGAFVPSKMRTAREAVRFARERSDVFLHTQSLRWTAVLDAERHSGVLPSTGAVLGAAKALIALHRSPDIIDEEDLADGPPYSLIVAPEQPWLDAGTVSRLEAFVRKGGALLTTGGSAHAPGMPALLGVSVEEPAALTDGHVFLRDRTPAGVYAPWDRVAPGEAEELYPLFRAYDDRNPEIGRIRGSYPITGMVDEDRPELAGCPAATIRRLGSGVIVHLPVVFFDPYWRFGNPDMLRWLRELLPSLQPEPLFTTDAPECVEVALRTKGDTLLVHLINGNPGRDISWVGTDDLWVDDIPPLGPFTVHIRCGRSPEDVAWSPGGAWAEARYEDGMLTVHTPRLDIHTCLVVRGWERPEGRG